MKPDMSAEAVSRRLRRVSDLVRACHALAGPRRKFKHLPESAGAEDSGGQAVRKEKSACEPKAGGVDEGTGE